MSFLSPQIPEMERLYGRPQETTYIQPVTPDEYDRIARSMKQDRSHDITLYIRKDNGFIFIAKYIYPPGLFRAPSGGVRPGENFEVGAKREALEETGTEIELKEYLLRINVRFQGSPDYIDWTSHVFLADYIGGDIDPQDKQEIKEARLISPDEIPGFAGKMRETGIGGLNYRAFLTEEVGRILDNNP